MGALEEDEADEAAEGGGKQRSSQNDRNNKRGRYKSVVRRYIHADGVVYGD